MPEYKVEKHTAVPSTFDPNTIYLVAPADSSTRLDVYMSTSDGTAIRGTFTQAQVEAIADSRIAAAGSGIVFVDDIAARDAIASPANGSRVYVRDATADATVDSGAATYIYDGANTAFVKDSESESLDVVLNWASIVGRPTSTPAQIDAAVTASHSHTNLSELEKIGESANGYLQYDGTDYVRGGSAAW